MRDNSTAPCRGWYVMAGLIAACTLAAVVVRFVFGLGTGTQFSQRSKSPP